MSQRRKISDYHGSYPFMVELQETTELHQWWILLIVFLPLKFNQPFVNLLHFNGIIWNNSMWYNPSVEIALIPLEMADINTSLEDLIFFKVTKIIAFSLNAFRLLGNKISKWICMLNLELDCMSSVLYYCSVCNSINENWIKAFLFQIWMTVLLK